MLQELIDDGKARLYTASWNLARCRRMGIHSNRDERLLREAETELLAALDHMHEVQGMVLVSF